MISGLGSAVSSNNTANIMQAQTQALQDENKINEFSKMFENAKDAEDAEIKEACVEFETYFLQLMMKEMRKTINKDDSYIKQSNAEKIFLESLDNELMAQAAQSGGVGLADTMYESLVRDRINVVDINNEV